MKILLEIACEEKMCGPCEHRNTHYTGLVGEFHATCEIFSGHYGDWGAYDMKRARPCIAAQKAAERLVK